MDHDISTLREALTRARRDSADADAALINARNIERGSLEALTRAEHNANAADSLNAYKLATVARDEARLDHQFRLRAIEQAAQSVSKARASLLAAQAALDASLEREHDAMLEHMADEIECAVAKIMPKVAALRAEIPDDLNRPINLARRSLSPLVTTALSRFTDKIDDNPLHVPSHILRSRASNGLLV